MLYLRDLDVWDEPIHSLMKYKAGRHPENWSHTVEHQLEVKAISLVSDAG